ncbi:lipopolysaccharide biosynthesis protein [Paenarthrobacter sp. YJN-5]|uniref:lipopolysaccharide biosynthesis protein n=1 Tax=Paenarthrobacter sp. YJN-5 TaxID=2735316 RepID=UPI0018775D55|nr:oligosaccharide flippase family protein [Paenarthrobacter sp. YJN-5]QOT16038.1 oligosaccharide flippase family protein [Paenarthrobacter sp. YJN-5]
MTVNLKGFRKNVMGLLAGQLTRLGLQAAYFVVLARMLGTAEYGAFAAALALAALVAPFSSLGANAIMVRNVSRNAAVASAEWLRALGYSVVVGLLLALGVTALTDLIAPPEVSYLTIFQVVIADVIGVKLVELAGMLWQALGRTRALIILPAVINACRLGAATVVMLMAPDIGLENWCTAYLVVTMPIAMAAVLVTTLKLGRAKAGFQLRWSDVREGMLFSIAGSAQNVYNDIDKAMLGRLSSVTSAGLYSAAYRVIDMAYAPIRAVAAAAYPHFFREGERGLYAAMHLTRKIAPLVLGLGALAAVGAFLAAPIAPLLLGADYAEAVDLIRLLALLIVLRAASYLAADTLTGCGRQGFRTLAQVGAALVNVGLNLIIIPTWSVYGAATVTLVCEGLLALVLWSHIWWVLRREKSGRGRRRLTKSRYRRRAGRRTGNRSHEPAEADKNPPLSVSS